MPPPLTFLRPTWVEIDRSAFAANIKKILKLAGKQTGLMAVLKADAYGHGAVTLAQVAVKCGISYIGLSSLEEGQRLRRQGIAAPILILGSAYPFIKSVPVALAERFSLTVSSMEGAKAMVTILRRGAAGDSPMWGQKRDSPLRGQSPRLKVHVKVDTGMTRLGVSPRYAKHLIRFVSQTKELDLEGIYTHFACAGVDHAFTRYQADMFEDVLSQVHREGINVKYVHAANSSATLSDLRLRYSLVRPGIALYGVGPYKDSRTKAGLKPVLSWKTRIVFIKTVPTGTGISYCRTFVTRKKMRLAVLPVGYADGYPLALSNCGQVLIHGRKCPVVGRVTMDQIIIDITKLPDAGVGDEAVLIGRQGKEFLYCEDVAEKAGAIAYELLCGISARVPRIYL